MKKFILQSCLSIFVGAALLSNGVVSAKTPIANYFSQFLEMQNHESHSDNKEMNHDETLLIPKKNKKVTIKKVFENERISVTFPKKPFIEQDGNYFATLELPGSEYCFMAPDPAISLADINVKELCDAFLVPFSEQMPEATVDYAITVYYDWTIFEFQAFNPVDQTTYKTKIIVTKHNFYVLSVSYLKASPSHDKFLNSITIQDI